MVWVLTSVKEFVNLKLDLIPHERIDLFRKFEEFISGEGIEIFLIDDLINPEGHAIWQVLPLTEALNQNEDVQHDFIADVGLGEDVKFVNEAWESEANEVDVEEAHHPHQPFVRGSKQSVGGLLVGEEEDII